MLNHITGMQVAQTEVNGTLLDADISPSDDLKITAICSKQVCASEALTEIHAPHWPMKIWIRIIRSYAYFQF